MAIYIQTLSYLLCFLLVSCTRYLLSSPPFFDFLLILVQNRVFTVAADLTQAEAARAASNAIKDKFNGKIDGFVYIPCPSIALSFCLLSSLVSIEHSPPPCFPDSYTRSYIPEILYILLRQSEIDTHISVILWEDGRVATASWKRTREILPRCSTTTCGLHGTASKLSCLS